MPIGLAPIDSSGNLPPSLPFYQPSIDQTTIDQVVESPPNFPTYNGFTVWDTWDEGNPSLVAIESWPLGTYTGLTSTATLSSYQRGHTDQYGYSGVQVLGSNVGFWLNTMDPTTQLFNGSNSLNMGCWYNAPPYAKLFPSLAQEVDVSFYTAVANDLSTGGTATSRLAYFEFVLEDESGDCYINLSAKTKCKFTYQVVYYSPKPGDANTQQVHTDSTNTTSWPIAQTTTNSTSWLHAATPNDSISFQARPFYPPQLVHFRIDAGDLVNVLNAVSSAAASQQSGYTNLSKNPLDYAITLIGVNGEVDPAAGAHAQLGMSVSGLRVTSTIPHHATGSPTAFNEPKPGVVYRDGPNINLFTSNLSGDPNTLLNLVSGSAAGDPAGYFANNIARVVYRDSNQHIREIFEQGGAWSEWDMTTSLGLSNTGSDPKPYVDASGSGYVVYRDLVGDVHQLSLDSSGWHDVDLSAISSPSAPTAAIGTPMGYVANGVPRIIYRDTNNQVVELYFFNDIWNQWQMTGVAGSAAAYSDPQGYVDSSGYPRVVYRDNAGDVHEIRMDSAGWHHTDITSLTGAAAAQGNPRGIVVGGAPRVIYRGTDNHLHELVWWTNSWVHNDLTQTRGAIPLLSDPFEFTGSDGVVRIEYVGSDNQLHELYYSSGWLHRDM
jgi:hypothetical protein